MADNRSAYQRLLDGLTLKDDKRSTPPPPQKPQAAGAVTQWEGATPKKKKTAPKQPLSTLGVLGSYLHL